MGDVVNLRLARKRMARAERERAADENRIRHGRTKTERSTAEAADERLRRLHEAHRREPAADGGEDETGGS